jgi:hypothetical protein
MLNTWNIVGLANTKSKHVIGIQDAKILDAVLSPLVSLYALEYAMPNDRATLTEVMRRENNRVDDNPNGVEVTLRYQLMMQKDALDNEFDGNRVHIMKGYTRDIYNPHIELTAADPTQGKDLIAAGYTLVTGTALQQDPADPSSVGRDLYVLRGRGLNDTITGFISYLSQKSKGSSMHGGLTSPLSTDTVHEYAAAVNAVVEGVKNPAIDALFQRDDNYDPRKNNDANYMAPVLNHAGSAVNYRYLMEETTKDNLLERENRLEKVVGHMAGAALNKRETPLVNKDGIQLLQDQFNAEFATTPEAFLEFSENSPDPIIRERYRLLPDKTKRDIRAIWGRDGMRVRNDVYNVAFGYRKASVGDVFNKFPEDRSKFENWFVNFMENTPMQWKDGEFVPLGKKAAVVLLRSERGWQEIVRLVKDIWVIKNLVTLLGNEFSNMTMLWLRGVRPDKILTGKVAAYRATFAYRKTKKERDTLQWTLDMGMLQGQAAVDAADALVVYNDTLTHNPVHELMEAGMYQTLVEDISAEDDPYSYQSRLGEWADQKTKRVPGAFKTIAKNVLMTHDTIGYKLLNDATIMSDFSARFVLHEHLTGRSRKPLSKEESLRVARAAFVNYDVPTHRATQYLNDMGILPFTKYYLRIQAALVDAVRSAPGRSVMLALGSDMLTTMPTILQSSMLLDPLPGSLSAGALELPGALPELATVRACV